MARPRPRGAMGVAAVAGAALAGLLAIYVGVCVLFIRNTGLNEVVVPFSASDAVLAEFNASCLSEACPVLGEGFFFGLATAPAHVEDDLDDAWIEFATRGGATGPERGPVRAFHGHAVPHERLRFWSEPEVELDLAKATGIQAFRMGVDWGRLVPVEPTGGTRSVLNMDAVKQYRVIMQKARARNLRLMVTLFHHSMPKWGLDWGGWTNQKIISYFVDFASVVKEEFGDLVDYWCTFNEPTIFLMLTHSVGAWPPGKPPSYIASFFSFLPFGEFMRAQRNIGEAHNLAYKVLREGSSTPVGVAHNVGWQRAFSLVDVPVVMLGNYLMLFAWTDQIQDHLDYCGLNYYGQEFVSMVGLQLVDDEEYSEAGRSVYPDGLFHLLLAFHKRYSKRNPKLRFIVTENGMADARDLIRRPYLVEHLLALHAAIKQGVPVDGYFHWTLSDNWEWADGYCPRFGLVDVERANNLTRRPRPSYYLWKEIVKTRKVTAQQRLQEWETLSQDAAAGGQRPFCRAIDYAGRMWADSLDTPTQRPISRNDWRFGAYRQPDLLLSSWRMLRVAWTLFADAGQLLQGKAGRGGSAESFAEKVTDAEEL